MHPHHNPALAGAGTSSSAPASETPATARTARTVGELVELYMAAYAGRDRSIGQRLDRWRALLGAHDLAALTDDEVFHALEAIAAEPARVYVGRDADAAPVHRAKGKRSPGTISRYHAALAGVFTWGIRRRRVPKGFENPCRKVPRPPERPGIVRFLSEEERTGLLKACEVSKWPRLYALVVMAITTGARKGELLGLRWRDLDLARAEASIAATKNGDPRVLPLVPGAREALERFAAEDRERFRLGMPAQLVFASRRRPDRAFQFDAAWAAALRAAKVRRFRFHDLRHTCASYLAQQGATLLEIADVMGHRQLAMVRRYSHLTTTTKKALVNRVLGAIR